MPATVEEALELDRLWGICAQGELPSDQVGEASDEEIERLLMSARARLHATFLGISNVCGFRQGMQPTERELVLASSRMIIEVLESRQGMEDGTERSLILRLAVLIPAIRNLPLMPDRKNILQRAADLLGPRRLMYGKPYNELIASAMVHIKKQIPYMRS